MRDTRGSPSHRIQRRAGIESGDARQERGAGIGDVAKINPRCGGREPELPLTAARLRHPNHRHALQTILIDVGDRIESVIDDRRRDSDRRRVFVGLENRRQVGIAG